MPLWAKSAHFDPRIAPPRGARPSPVELINRSAIPDVTTRPCRFRRPSISARGPGSALRERGRSDLGRSVGLALRMRSPSELDLDGLRRALRRTVMDRLDVVAV